MASLYKGFILGFVMVLPGMSGGTLLVIFGIYESLIRDLGKLNLKPYIPFVGGAIGGIFASGFLFAMFFEAHRNPTIALLLGCLLASIRAVLNDCPKLNKKYVIVMGLGLLFGYFMVAEPVNIVNAGDKVSWWLLLIGGALSSAAMIIPGVPGSSVLIVLGIYDAILFYIKEISLLQLSIFGIGGILGIALLVKLLEKVYQSYKGAISYFFVGLIIGSCRGLIPSTINITILMLFAIGFALVWWWSGIENKVADEK
ncbi:undecaprenyl phosphate translocase family protein [Alkaliphilus hydrothermalis]|uniref:Membrane protein n=1 Tax=Alkaliphilus hydrothermalis TaxID=1482730 RepID=A0ABS2NR76_9FIRM|nr:DUF368 domain-containing protein [Alkaliphilus hydrothermalis]MBM7615069.1 putative membrane protein [Alkaliphilus hydrothermalis]